MGSPEWEKNMAPPGKPLWFLVLNPLRVEGALVVS